MKQPLSRRHFLQSSAVAGLALAGGGTRAAGETSTQPAEPARPASRAANAQPIHRCLFLDDGHIAGMQGLKRVAHPAKRYPQNPIMLKQFPWEKTRLQLYGRCIVFNPETKLYQMYYIAQPLASHHPYVSVNGVQKVGHVTLPAYAQSADGIHWDRPMLGVCSFNDIKETNLLGFVRGQSFEPGMVYDSHDPDPARRYKMFYWDQKCNLLPPGTIDFKGQWGYDAKVLVKDDSGKIIYEHPYDDWGMEVAFSPDGVHWSRHGDDYVFSCYSDTGQSALYDPRLKQYVAFGRFNMVPLATGGKFSCARNVARVESEDFLRWSSPELVLCADEQDPQSLQINSMPVDLYEGLYIGLMELDVRPNPTPHRPIQLAVSRDGRCWTRVADRVPMMEPAAKGAWDDHTGTGWVRPAGGLFIHDDQVRMYYSGGNAEDPFAGVGMATWRRDGFVSLHAGADGGELLTPAILTQGTELHLNLDASDGEATVQVCGHQGALQPWKLSRKSQPIHGDHLDVTVRWNETDFRDLLGSGYAKPLTLRIQLRNAHLYSFWMS